VAVTVGPWIRALCHTSVTRDVGDLWHLSVSASSVPTLTVTPPSGAAPAPVVGTAAGVTTFTVLLDLPGRWVASVAAADGGVATFAAWAGTIVPASGMPDADAVSLYMGDHSYDPADIQDALDAEAAAQRATCRIPAVYGADLANALKRRTQRNLFMRKLPLALPAGDADTGPQYLPANDPEVRRFERPYRRMGIG
jgi:hypothetical protein